MTVYLLLAVSKLGNVMLALHHIVPWSGLSVHPTVSLVAVMWLFCCWWWCFVFFFLHLLEVIEQLSLV